MFTICLPGRPPQQSKNKNVFYDFLDTKYIYINEYMHSLHVDIISFHFLFVYDVYLEDYACSLFGSRLVLLSVFGFVAHSDDF